MHAFERDRGIQSLAFRKPEKSRTLDDKKWPEPFPASERRMAKRAEKPGRNRTIPFRMLNFCPDERTETGFR